MIFVNSLLGKILRRLFFLYRLSIKKDGFNDRGLMTVWDEG